MENGRAQVPGCQGQFIIAVYMCAGLKFVWVNGCSAGAAIISRVIFKPSNSHSSV